MTAAANIRAGTFWINDPLTDNDAGRWGHAPFRDGMGARYRGSRRVPRYQTHSPGLQDPPHAKLVPLRLELSKEVLVILHAREESDEIY